VSGEIAAGGAGHAAFPMRWARLTWQVAEPEAWAAALAHRLDVVASATGRGVWRLDLGGEPLDIVPWRREGPADAPSPEGRLAFEPIAGGGPAPERTPDASLTLVGVAWSTVELDRAEADLEPWLLATDPALGDGDAASDPHLGARVRCRRAVALPGEVLVLAEPSTEGRLAASLARDGEGPCALYLAPSGPLATWAVAARARGVTVSARREGPLGPAVLLAGRIVAGPHLLVIDPPATGLGPSTIAP
jgi:hypothetical protein